MPIKSYMRNSGLPNRFGYIRSPHRGSIPHPQAKRKRKNLVGRKKAPCKGHNLGFAPFVLLVPPSSAQNLWNGFAFSRFFFHKKIQIKEAGLKTCLFYWHPQQESQPGFCAPLSSCPTHVGAKPVKRLRLFEVLLPQNIQTKEAGLKTCLFYWHPQQESNLQLPLRRGLLYPFN